MIQNEQERKIVEEQLRELGRVDILMLLIGKRCNHWVI